MKFFSLLFCIVAISSCAPNNVKTEDSLKKYFDENNVSGCFGIYDNGQDKFTIYNLARFKDSAYLPASTFKIINSLIGLQTGIISNEKMIIPWDGITRPVADWNKDLTMEEAFRVSAVPYYQEVARRIGKDTMQHWLDTLGYARRYDTPRITNNLDTFWLDNSFKVTPDEEMGIIKKLYFDQLPFQKRVQDIVKKVMFQEENANYKLSYKTGLGNSNGKYIGWIAGWVEENQHPYFFVLNIEGSSSARVANARKPMLMGILKQLGFLEGRK